MTKKKIKKAYGVRCDKCDTLWHSSLKKDGDKCELKINNKVCKGTCKGL